MLCKKFPPETRQGGFTLIELLVVVLIIAILAAIAIPVFISQRQKAYIGDVNSALREAATAAEAYGLENDGNYSGLDGDIGPLLEAQGYAASTAVSISVASTATDYCLTTTYSILPAGHDWRVATFDKDLGRPTDANAC
jgi:type IV pilus assembly protein PilA